MPNARWAMCCSIWIRRRCATMVERRRRETPTTSNGGRQCGTSEYNLALGGRRAGAVKDYLVSLGVAADRITTISKGKEQPVCTEQTEACWQQNRRAFHIITAK
jgi:peptidoglycan-associated lipoprotein